MLFPNEEKNNFIFDCCVQYSMIKTFELDLFNVLLNENERKILFV